MRLPVCCCLLLLVVGSRGQEAGFDLTDGLVPKSADGLKPTTKPQPGEGGATDVPVDLPRKPAAKPQPGGGNEFVLGDGVGEDPYKKPTVKPQPGRGGGGGDGDEFDLGDAVNGEDPYKKPTVKPQPGRRGGGGGGDVFGDGDLGEVHPNDPSGPDKPSGGEEPAQGGEQQSMVAGIVGAVAAAAVAAVSSFIAYQKKKLCFKGATDDPENVNMDSHKGDQSEPQAQSTLLAK